jgi:hypothetical protein
MAWLTTVQQRTGVAYKVRWREPGLRSPRNRNFRTPTEAAAFRDEMNVLYPERKSGPAESSLLSVKDRVLRSFQLDGNGCWRWQMKVGKNGYGFIGVVGETGQKMLLAHRVAYEQLVGPIPAGLQIDHLCRVRDCVNPAHLEPVTGAENLRRAHQAKALPGTKAGA